MTARRLENIAVFYLQRFSATTAHLKRVLLRRIDKSLKAKTSRPPAPRAEMLGWVDELIGRLVANGSLNDTAYAETLAGRLRRQGKNATFIRSRLAAKSVPSAVIGEVLGRTMDDGDDRAFAAALAYARRRRLGPFRATPPDRDTERKDMGALVRAGFGFEVVRRVMRHRIETAGP
jgi:regulatory protein